MFDAACLNEASAKGLPLRGQQRHVLLKFEYLSLVVILPLLQRPPARGLDKGGRLGEEFSDQGGRLGDELRGSDPCLRLGRLAGQGDLMATRGRVGVTQVTRWSHGGHAEVTRPRNAHELAAR